MMSTGRALAILAAVITVIALYSGLALWLGVKDSWVGFLFLTQWTVVDGGKVTQLPRTVLGALSGMTTALIPSLLSPHLGYGPAMAVMLSLILVTVFLFISGRASQVINAATMIFLTVLSIPEITAHAAPADLFMGFALGLAYFGGLGFVGSLFAKFAKGRSPDPQSAET